MGKWPGKLQTTFSPSFYFLFLAPCFPVPLPFSQTTLCPDPPSTACNSDNFTCDLTSATFFAGVVDTAGKCASQAALANLDILYTFWNRVSQICYGFTAADCPNGLVANPGFEGTVIQYADPSATCLTLPCTGLDPSDYFTTITAKAGHGKAGTFRGKPVRYTLTLVPRKDQPSPALPGSLDLRVNLSPYLEVSKADVKGDAGGSAALTADINRDEDTVTWENVGAALLGVGTRKAAPQKLTFSIVATLDEDIPEGADIQIQAYLVDDSGDVCEVRVAETEVTVREPVRVKDSKQGGRHN